MSLDTHQKSDMKPYAKRTYLLHLCFSFKKGGNGGASERCTHFCTKQIIFFSVLSAACSKRNLCDMNFSFHLDEIISNVYLCVCSKYGIRTLGLRSFKKFSCFTASLHIDISINIYIHSADSNAQIECRFHVTISFISYI